MKKMKFRRFIYKLLKYSLFACVIVSTAKLISFSNEQRRENLRRERRRSTAIAIIICIFSIGAAFAAGYAALREVRRRRGGYLFDLFDRDEYDVVEPDEEELFEDIIRGELNGHDEDGNTSAVLCSERIPLDEEDTSENYKQ